jgi:dUTP pyrophosphatase
MPDCLYATIDGKSSYNRREIITFRGIIDAGYRGEVSVFMKNTTGNRITIQRWQRFAQMIFHYSVPVYFISTGELAPSERGEGGFGSTGQF